MRARLPRIDVSGKFLAPAVIDSHVHVAYYPAQAALAAGGVAAAVDLAAPFDALDADYSPLEVAFAGPMLTAPSGYPTRSWGSQGYGLEIGTPEAARSAVDRLFRGRRHRGRLARARRDQHAVRVRRRERARESAQAARARRACALWHGLRQHACDGRERARAGLDPAAILASTSAEPAAYWGFSELGAIAVGKAASLLVLPDDPLSDPSALARPVAVYLHGRLQEL
jgi:hypothetical protein